MEVIQNNPYRILGLLVGASATEQRKHCKRIPQFLQNNEDQIPDEFTKYTFPVLGNFHFSEDTVNSASSKLDLAPDKLNAALFWFYKGYPTDEEVIDILIDGDIQKATDLWTDKITSGTVSKRNYSAFHNLSNFHLLYSIKDSTINSNFLEQGIALKLKFLESDFLSEFIEIATDKTFKPTKKEVQLMFLNCVHSEIEKSGGLSTNKFIEIINKQMFVAKDDFLSELLKKPFAELEKIVEETKNKRKDNSVIADKLGNELSKKAKENITVIKSILGTSNFRFASISDKVADEILQCGIDYYKHFKDTDNEPGKVAMELFLYAQSIAVETIAKQRCQENIENLQEWIAEKSISEDFGYIIQQLKEFETKNPNLGYAQNFVNNCKPRLLKIKTISGNDYKSYLEVSGRVVRNSMNKLLVFLTEEKSIFEFVVNFTSSSAFDIYKILSKRYGSNKPYNRDNFIEILTIATSLSLKEPSFWGKGILSAVLCDGGGTNSFIAKNNFVAVIQDSIDLMKSTEELDMDSETKKSHLEMSSIIQTLYQNINKLTVSQPSPPSNTGSGCYIATMAYGDYNHPQVIVLRKYRDEVLSKSVLGNLFIKIYYLYSPKLVEKLKGKNITNAIIRKILNNIIKIIKK